jgi:hypothetical protein
MVKRYELSEAQWLRIKDLLPGKAGDPGRNGRDNRLFVHGVLGFCVPVRTGMTCPSDTANGRASTPASRVGPKPVCGSASLRF